MSDFAPVGNLDKKQYFEGWYYKNTTEDKKVTISIIPGIALSSKEKHAFIQVIENKHHKSYYIPYSLEDVHIHKNPTCIQIKDNYFYEDYIDLTIDEEDLSLHGYLYYSEMKRPKKTKYMPGMMGPFSYFKMECAHEVISLHHHIDGVLTYNHEVIDFEDGTGYLEKDYGTSFPREYMWLQTNSLFKEGLSYECVSLFFALAKIPFKFWHFNGFIASFYLNDTEYRFATYNGAKVEKMYNENGIYKINIKKRKYTLTIRLQPKEVMALRSPKLGNMEDTVWESLDTVCHVTLKEKKKILFQQKMIAAGYEKKES